MQQIFSFFKYARLVTLAVAIVICTYILFSDIPSGYEWWELLIRTVVCGAISAGLIALTLSPMFKAYDSVAEILKRCEREGIRYNND